MITQINNIFIILILISGCTNDISENKQQKEIKILKQENNFISSKNKEDSNYILTKLYKNLTIFPSNNFSDFSYSVSFIEKDKLITVRSENIIAEHKLEYYIILKDINNRYKQKDFSIHDESYKYIDSYFKVDGKKLGLKDSFLSNSSYALIKK